MCCKNFLLKVWFGRYFSCSLAVFKERGEPLNFWIFAPPRAKQGAKIVRANLRIVHTFGYVKVSASPAPLRGAGSAAKLNGKLKEKINFWFRCRLRRQ